MCGTVQLVVDFVIIGQIYMYQKEHKAKNFIKSIWLERECLDWFVLELSLINFLDGKNRLFLKKWQSLN